MIQAPLGGSIDTDPARIREDPITGEGVSVYGEICVLKAFVQVLVWENKVSNATIIW